MERGLLEPAPATGKGTGSKEPEGTPEEAVVGSPDVRGASPVHESSRVSIKLATDDLYEHRCVHTKDDDIATIGDERERALIEPLAREIEDWYNRNAPEALARVSGGAGRVDMTPYGDELDKILDEWLPKIFREGVSIGAGEVGVDVDAALEEAAEAAVEYARERGSLIRQTVTESAGDALTASVESAIQSGLQRGEAIRDIAERITEVSPARAERIARTEAQEAAWGGHFQSWDDAGVERAEWVLGPSPCPICEAIVRNNRGPQPLGHVYSQGKLGPITRPPAHPNCTCGMVAVIDEGGDE